MRLPVTQSTIREHVSIVSSQTACLSISFGG
ncbi:hypothetical protein PSPO01_12436 [Paraphaeosphaeria sporulosa]